MSLLPIPDLLLNSIYELDPAWLTARGIRLVILDIDNTVAPYTVHEADGAMRAWVDGLKAAGLAVHVLSNNRGTRPEVFSGALGLPFRKKAWKPFTKGAKAILAQTGVSASQTAFIGDQIYTDVCCAKWCGAMAVLVEPIELHRAALRFRYHLERPFRALARRRGKSSL